MGGRGASASYGQASTGMGGNMSATATASAGGGGGIANQAPTTANTPYVPNAVGVLAGMNDQQLTQLYNQSRTVDMPNHLSDASDATQKFVYMAGINGKPQVMDAQALRQYMRQNGISTSEMLARTTGGASYSVRGTTIQLSPTQVSDLTKYGDLTYVGGKHGGNVHGSGTYFDMNGGRNTGYGRGNSTTLVGVLSKNARIIDDGTLRRQTQTWIQSHPRFARAVGAYDYNTKSIYALAQGYNVIRAGSYHNVIDRTALILQDTNV